jgi:hypothetical protein
MVEETTQYFNQMSSVVPVALQMKWKAEITLAESQRLKTPPVMDILGVQKQKISPGPDPIGLSGPDETEHWLDLAISIEERQYVNLSHREKHA